MNWKRGLAALLCLALVCACPALAAEAEEADALAGPAGLAALPEGGLLAADKAGNRLIKVDGQKTSVYTGSALGVAAYVDGKAEEAYFSAPTDLAPFLEGWAVSDAGNHVVRYVADGTVATAAGSGQPGFKDGVGAKASFNSPRGLAADGEGNLYIADCYNHAIRVLSPKGKVTTLTGGTAGYADGALAAARFDSPTGLAWQDGALYVCDSGNQRIRVIKDGVVSTLAGAPVAYEDADKLAGDYVDGPVSQARFSNPVDVAVAGERVYVADRLNAAVRLIENGTVSTLLADPALLGEPTGLALQGETLYVADGFYGDIYAVPAAPGETALPFTDLADGAETEAVRFVFHHGLFNGVSETEFAPDTTLNRAMFVTVVGRLCAQVYRDTLVDGDAAFSDVAADAWYAPAVRWAADNGVVNGVSETEFAPLSSLTREQLAVLLYRAAGLVEWYTPPEVQGEAPAGVSDWAAEAAAWALETGILDPAQPLRPSEPATRGEAALALAAFWNEVVAD